MSPVHLRKLGFQRNQPEDREGLSRTRRLGGGNLGNSGGWEYIEGNNSNTAIHIPIQQKPQTRGLEGYRSSSSPPPTPQRHFSMEHGQQEVQPSIPLGITWRKLPEDMSQRDRLQRPQGNHQRLEYHQEFQTPGGEGKQDKGESSHDPSYRRTADPESAYSDSFRLTRRETRIQGKKQDLFQPKAERVRNNYPEAVGLGERSTQQPEIVVHTPRISSPINRNITPTQIEHNVVIPESNLSSYALCLQMSQFAEQPQKQFSELQESHERRKTLTASMEKTVKNIQEGHAQLRKPYEETNRRLNQVFEEQHPSKRDRDFMDQEIKKLFNVYHNMKPQPQGHVMDNPYQQEDIKLDSTLGNKERSSSQYQDGGSMSYSEKEALKQLPDGSSWPKFSGTGEYDHMKLIDFIDGLF
ncbi:hypothetical protein O181_012901 [Austropuccinia psidii MF-1]|uniref:Uncharacterized protein n=1 Tax=Austropuccinia psidii MF-1 TaxID=1389203 RepID=A0A9Q3GMQ7_9BASI|nr:hypothetical protein [Austropuccinia psidii MF-1]